MAINIKKGDARTFFLEADPKSKSFRAFADGDYISIVSDVEKNPSITNRTYYKNFITRSADGSILVDGTSGGTVTELVQSINEIVNFSGGSVSIIPDNLIFADAAARDAYFDPDRLDELITGLEILLEDDGSGNRIIERWVGESSPPSYPATPADFWVAIGGSSLTAAQIKVLYESNPETNALVDEALAILNKLSLEPNGDIKSSASFIFPPGSAQVGDSKISSGGRAVVTESLSTGNKGAFGIQLFDDTSYKKATVFDPSQTSAQFPVQDTDDSVVSGIRNNNFSQIVQADVQFMAIQFKPEGGIISQAFKFTIRINSLTTPPSYEETVELTDPNLSDLGGGVWQLKLNNPNIYDAGFRVYIESQDISLLGGNGFNGPVLFGDTTNNNFFPYLEAVSIPINRLDVLTEENLTQRQLIRSGVKGNFTVASQTGNTEIAVSAVGGSFEVFINGDPDTDNLDGVSIQVPDQVLNVPVDAVARKYYGSVTDSGAIAIGTTKTTSDNITTIHLLEFIAQNGELVPESLRADPFVTYSDKTLQGILDTDRIRIDDLIIESTGDNNLTLAHTAFDVIGNGQNWENDKINPHIRNVPEASPMAWTYVLQTQTDVPPIGVDTTLNTTQWDDGGTLTNLTGIQATVQLVLVEGNDFVVLPGQQVFDNYDTALLNADDVRFFLPPVLFDAVEVGRIVIKNGATDSGDTDEITIKNLPGTFSGGGTPAPTTNFFDVDFKLLNGVDNSKIARFDAGNVPAGTTNIYDFPEEEGELVVNSPKDYKIIENIDYNMEQKDRLIMADASTQAIELVLPDNPTEGQRHIFFVKDNTNAIDLVSNDPGAPIGNPVQVQPTFLQGQWVLSSDFEDTSGNDRDLAQQGTGGQFTPKIINGRSVNMYDTEGTQWFQSTGYKGILGTTQRTFTCWYCANQLTEPTSIQDLISWGVAAEGQWWTVGFQVNSFVAGIYAANKKWNYTKPDVAVLWDGNPHHITIRQNGPSTSTFQLLIDGVIVGASSQDTFPSMNTQPGADVTIGTSFSATERLIDGCLYDVRIWNKWLSDVEINTVKTENLGGGVNISALQDNSVIEASFDGTEWRVTDTLYDFVSDLRSDLDSLAEVARTGDYNDLDNKPIIESFTETASIFAGEFWYRVTSTPLGEGGENDQLGIINAIYTVDMDTESTINRGRETMMFSVSMIARDDTELPSINVLSSHTEGNFINVSGIRVVAEQSSSFIGQYHVEIRIDNTSGNTATASVAIGNRAVNDNQLPANLIRVDTTTTPPARVSKSISVANKMFDANDAFSINKSGFLNYGGSQGHIMRASANNIPWALVVVNQGPLGTTKSANASVVPGTVYTNTILNQSGLVEWLNTSDGGELIEVGNVVNSQKVISITETGNSHQYILDKTGYYEFSVEATILNGDSPDAAYAIVQLNSSNEVIKTVQGYEIGIANPIPLNMKWSGYYNAGESFTIVKTAGFGVGDSLAMKSPRVEIKFMGVI